MKVARGFVDSPRVFDTVVMVLTAALVFGAYLTAYAYVYRQNAVDLPVSQIGTGIVLGAWLGYTLVLFAAFAIRVGAGRPWNNALPDGYVGSLAATLIFGGAWIVDSTYWAPDVTPGAVGLDALFTPPRLVLIAATAVMVSGPLRAAARRGETVAGITTLVSAALLLSVFTFATQFAHPLIDPWAQLNFPLASNPAFVGENLGVASVLAQALILAGTGLLLNSGFTLRPASLTVVFTINGLLVTTTKLHYFFVPVMFVTGLAADAWIAYTSRRPGRPSASLCAVIGGTFVLAFMASIYIRYGSGWTLSLWAGTVVAATMMCWMMGRLLRAGLPATIVVAVQPTAPPLHVPIDDRQEVRWTRDPASTVRPQLVRAALDDLGTPEALGRSPLGTLPGIAHGESTAADLRAALIDVISELAASPQPRDAEAGRLLFDYYVKRVGSHEVIMERLHLSHPTFYRRLHRGFALVAERLDEMSEFASNVTVS